MSRNYKLRNPEGVYFVSFAGTIQKVNKLKRSY